MKFGVFVGPMCPGDMDAADAFELARAMARTAHESGFDGIFAAHHYALGPSHQMFHPGYRVPEFQSFGIPRHERGARLVEAVSAIRRLWADDPATYEGPSTSSTASRSARSRSSGQGRPYG